ncbi:MAG: zinc-dependent metalloprotease [Propionibacteriaceae bacterium]|nr:zinc-dependent metalloprotease [Propionibacteriaceae bacterium]
MSQPDATDPQDPQEFLRKIFAELGLPDNVDLNEEADRKDLLAKMINRLTPFTSIPQEQAVWDTARQTARQVVARLGPDPTGGTRMLRRANDAYRLVELWLNEATSFPPSAMPPLVWSRAEWIEATMPAWRSMIAPVIDVLSTAIVSAASTDLPESAPAELAGFQSIMHPLMNRAIGGLFGAQVGEGLGWAATATMTGTDFGLPVMAGPQVAVLPTNLSAVQQQGDLDVEALLLYCVLRESARVRLFQEIGWIAPSMIALVQHYAREMQVDPQAISDAMRQVAPDSFSAEAIAAFNHDFSAMLFQSDPTAEQSAIMERLSLLVALVEGWVDDVASVVADQWLPNWRQISESLHRERVTSKVSNRGLIPVLGGIADPKLVRQATGFWAAVRADRGTEGRDDIWRQPDGMPDAADLSDPQSFLTTADAPLDPIDEELRRLLDGSDESGTASDQQ